MKDKGKTRVNGNVDLRKIYAPLMESDKKFYNAICCGYI